LLRIELRSLSENIVDTTSPSGKLVFGIFALLGEFERDLLRQRTRAGLAAARKRGRVGGRPKSINVSDLCEAKAMLASGDYGKGDVARELGVSRHTLWRELAQAKAGRLASEAARRSWDRATAEATFRQLPQIRLAQGLLC
jgi:DNA invertase Pin-like site-specific DNA recombinase